MSLKLVNISQMIIGIVAFCNVEQAIKDDKWKDITDYNVMKIIFLFLSENYLKLQIKCTCMIN